MEPKLFIVNTWFSKFGAKYKTWDRPFGREDVNEIFLAKLSKKKMKEILGAEDFLIISDISLSVMHAARIFEPRENEEKILWNWPPPYKPKETENNWDDFLKERSPEQLESLIKVYAEKISKTFQTENKHIVLFLDPGIVRKFLVSTGMDPMKVFLSTGGSGADQIFICDRSQKYIETLYPFDDLSKKQQEDEFTGIFGTSDMEMMRRLTLEELFATYTVKYKLKNLSNLDYNIETIANKYLEFLN